ncbi:MAG: hypothetical protein RBG13Loki_4202 [Promethearchaeota archaeon CR_4]|nr:MAG: hypothetical protein RBG13Loki_4202 [Candidatus Lokiarchaeota archaeon CR_4]
MTVLKCAYGINNESNIFDDIYKGFLDENLKTQINCVDKAIEKLILGYLSGPHKMSPFESGIWPGDGEFCPKKCEQNVYHKSCRRNGKDKEYQNAFENIFPIFKYLDLFHMSILALTRPEIPLPKYVVSFTVIGNERMRNFVAEKAREFNTGFFIRTMPQDFTLHLHNTPIVQYFRCELIHNPLDKAKIGFLYFWFDGFMFNPTALPPIPAFQEQVFKRLGLDVSDFPSYKFILENEFYKTPNTISYVPDSFKDLQFCSGAIFGLPTWLNKNPDKKSLKDQINGSFYRSLVPYWVAARYHTTFQSHVSDHSLLRDFWSADEKLEKNSRSLDFHDSVKVIMYPWWDCYWSCPTEKFQKINEHDAILFSSFMSEIPLKLTIEVEGIIDCDVFGWDFNYDARAVIYLKTDDSHPKQEEGEIKNIIYCRLQHWPKDPPRWKNASARKEILRSYKVYGKATIDVLPGMKVMIRKTQQLWAPSHSNDDVRFRFTMSFRIVDIHVSWAEAPDLY